MAIDPVSLTESLQAFDKVFATEAKQFTNKSEFSQWFESQLSEINSQIKTSESELRQLATGETSNIHHVMMSLEKAKTSFQLALQVRNKLLEGYQEIMRMQI